MSKRFLRLFSLLCVCALWLTALTLPASAEAARRELTLSLEVREEASLSRDGTTPAFWEWPALTPGQSLTGGTLTLRNTTAYTVQFALDRVVLPYDDTAVLDYLNAVTLTLSRDGEVLFSDRFVRLADFSCDLGTFKTDESVTLTVDMSCAFAYTGTQTAVHPPVEWRFSAKTAGTNEPVVPEISRPLLAVGLGCGAALLVGVCLLWRFISRKKREQPPV